MSDTPPLTSTRLPKIDSYNFSVCTRMRKVNRVVWNFDESAFTIRYFNGVNLDDFDKQVLWTMFYGLKKHMKIGDKITIALPEVRQQVTLERWRHLTYHFIMEDLEN